MGYRIKHNRYTIHVVAVLCVFLLLCTLYFSYRLFAVDTSHVFDSIVWIEIPSGAGTHQAAKILTDAGILRHPRLFVFIARISGMHKKIRAGRFRFERPMSTWEILRKITKGGSFDVPITIPEGFTIYQIAGLVEQLGIDSIAFLASCRDSALLDRIGIPGLAAEGFLFPETYHIPRGTDADSAIAIMFNEFQSRWKPQYTARAESIKMSMLQITILASIVEAEAHVKHEQSIISSVYHNRMRIGMMLQADPTTIYGMKKFDKPLLLKDLDNDSPYNTYRRFGLPPGAICNPGEDAIRATLYPDSTEFIYFVSRRNGKHIFSKTIREHHRAIQQVKKLKQS